NHTDCPLTDFGGKTSIFSHPVYLFLRKFSLQDSRGGSFLIMNGGAAIALLAFLGNIWNKNSSAEAASAIASALYLFCGGVVLAGLCSGLSYFSQCCFASSYLGTKKFYLWLGHTINAVACICGAGSIFIFAYGSYCAYQSMIAQLVK
ncbi:hypothetical protein, partial [Escherichia coli]